MRLLPRRDHAVTAAARSPQVMGSPQAAPSTSGSSPGVFFSGTRTLLRLLARPLRGGQALAGLKVTVSLEDGLVRVVVFDGPNVMAWGTAAPQEEPEAHQRRDSDQVARLRTLLDNLRVRRGRVITDMPFQAPLMRRLHLPKVRRRYLAEVVSAEVLDTIPFLAEEADLAWQVRRNDTGLDVFAIAVAKTVVDEQVQVLKGAGLRPLAAYSKAAALAHAAGLSDGIIAHCGPSLVTLVLVRQWEPEAVHQVPLGTEPSQQADVVSAALGQVASYQRPADPRGPGQRLPVVLTGQVPRTGPLMEVLQRAGGVSIAPPLKYPEHFSPAEHAVNLGLALADHVRARSHGRVLRQGTPAINLLPVRSLPRPFPVRPVAAFVGLLLLATPALTFAQQVETVRGESIALQSRVTNLKTQERELRLAQGHAGGIEQATRSVAQTVAGMETLLIRLKADREGLLTRVETLAHRARPAGVAVSSLGQKPDGFIIVGTARSYADVFQYTANLRASGLFTEVKIAFVQSAVGGQASPEAQEPGGAGSPAPLTTAFQVVIKSASGVGAGSGG